MRVKNVKMVKSNNIKKLIPLLPTTRIYELASNLVIEDTVGSLYLIKQRGVLAHNPKLLENKNFKRLSSKDFIGVSDFIEYIKRADELVEPGENLVYKVQTRVESYIGK